jgi:aminoglycoside phosphotransferase (APT) family kinase protein
MDRHEITNDLAVALVADQFPHWADLPVVAVPHNGWDNTTFRLGEELSVRLPSGDGYAAQVDKEHRWLPVLAPHLPLAIPEPVALGRPSCGYPWPWSIYRWIDGQPANRARIANLNQLAAELAGFLTALSAIDATAGPPAGKHSAARGGPLTTWDEWTRESIDLLTDVVDAGALTEVWETALASTWEVPPVWVHGDVASSNLLIVDGELHAVIDFGCSAVGDPSCDLVIAWTFFDHDSREVFRRCLPLDEDTWARGRGWALWKALVTLAGDKQRDGHSDAAAQRMGWRHTPRRVVDLVLADHLRAAGR